MMAREIIWRVGIKLMQLVIRYRVLTYSGLWAIGACLVHWVEERSKADDRRNSIGDDLHQV